MKRLTEEATPRHVEVIQYSASIGIRVRGENAKSGKDVGFWPMVLDGFYEKKLMKEEADRAERRVREVTGWSDPIEERTSFVEATCQNYEVLVDNKRVGKARGAAPSNRYEIRSDPKQNDACPPAHKKRLCFRASD
mgnify:CR=1 FL=1